MKTWTDEEVDLLLCYYNTATNSQLAVVFPDKTPLAIYKKAYKLGLRKTPEIKFLNRSESMRREKASRWNGGIRKTQKGYRMVLCPEHHRADSSGYVMEHIFVWEKETGFPVPSNCCIHHLNGDKADNRIQNLCLMQHAAHTVFHHTGAKRSEETKEKISKSKTNKSIGRKNIC